MTYTRNWDFTRHGVRFTATVTKMEGRTYSLTVRTSSRQTASTTFTLDKTTGVLDFAHRDAERLVDEAHTRSGYAVKYVVVVGMPGYAVRASELPNGVTLAAYYGLGTRPRCVFAVSSDYTAEAVAAFFATQDTSWWDKPERTLTVTSRVASSILDAFAHPSEDDAAKDRCPEDRRYLTPDRLDTMFALDAAIEAATTVWEQQADSVLVAMEAALAEADGQAYRDGMAEMIEVYKRARA